MPTGKQIWGYEPTTKVFLPVKVDSSGRLVLDAALLFEDTPTDGETKKGPTSNWAYDHENDTQLHTDILTTRGDLLYQDASGRARLAKGTSGQVLTMGANDPGWAAPIVDSPGEGHITILPFNYNSIGQGTWVIGINVGQALYYTFYNISHNDGDNLTFKVYLAAGTYTLAVLYIKYSDRGILDIDIDGAEIASIDMYDAATLQNQWSTDAGNVISTPGLKTLTLRVDGKNASSSSYYATITAIALWRTA